jgi:16S rRNA (uracil1498-N3)-methyltransferase
MLQVHGQISERLRCVAEATLAPVPEPALHVAVCQGLTRAERMEYVLQKGSELGAWEFYPLITARTVVRPDGLRSAARLGRWRRITEEAALQSGRAHIPPVHPVLALSDLATKMAADPCDLMVVPYEEEVATLRDVLRSRLPRTPAAGPDLAEAAASGARPGARAGAVSTAAVVIGPEGGFERSEIAMLREAGFTPVSLGPRILRTETAGPVVLSLLLYEFGDLGGAGVER